VDVDTFSIPTQAGDLFMLCSDGLTSMVEDDAILEAAEKHRADLQAAVKALIRAANKGGGEDNITVVLFEIGDGAGEPLEETAQYPVLGADGDGEVDEDTIDEVDRVPAVDTMVVAPGHVQLPQRDRHRRRALRRDGSRSARRLPAPGGLQVHLRPVRDRPARAAGLTGHRHDGQRRPPLDPLWLAPVPAWRPREALPNRLPCRLPA